MSPRLVAGLAFLIFGKSLLVGALFAPLPVLVKDPGLVPMPERLVGFWIIGLGVLLIIPWRRERGPGAEEEVPSSHHGSP